jgi:hypothetical protein
MRVAESIQTTAANKQTTIRLADVFKLNEFIQILLNKGMALLLLASFSFPLCTFL